MKNHLLKPWFCLGLLAIGNANAETILNADFESSPIGRTPSLSLPGTPAGDKFITADAIPVVPFGITAGSGRAIKFQPSTGRTEAKVEFQSTILAPGPRNTQVINGTGRWQGDGKKDDLVMTLSMDGTRVFGILEFRDRQLHFGEVGAGGGLTRFHRVANCPMEAVHYWGVQVNPITRKCDVVFRDASGRIVNAKQFPCPNAPYLGNARTISLTCQYFDPEPGHRSYLVDRVNAFVNSP